MKTCLIVIDVQESFRHRPFFTERHLPAYLQAQNALIDGCVAQGIPVLRVFHSDGPEVAEKFKTFGYDQFPTTRAQFNQFVKDEAQRFGDVIRKANVSLD